MERVYTTPLLDKLGLRPGMRVALIDIDDPDIRPLIAERTTELTEGWPEPETDIVLLGADSIAALAPLEDLAGTHPPERRDLGRLAQGEGGHAPRRRGHGRRPKAAGLVDNKVASFSATHTALRLVIPVARRPR